MIRFEIHLSPPSARRSVRCRRFFLAAGVLASAIPVLALAAPVTIPHQFSDGAIISADEFNENFDALAGAVNDNDTRIGALEEAPAPQLTIRKVTSTGPADTAIAFCEENEVLTGGGCFLPPENDYDPAYPDQQFDTGGFLRPLVGLTSVPVAAGTLPADLRPTTAVANIMPFAGDIVADDDGSVAAEPGGGWACRAGIVQLDSASGAQTIATNLYETWFFPVKAYAVCMSVE